MHKQAVVTAGGNTSRGHMVLPRGGIMNMGEWTQRGDTTAQAVVKMKRARRGKPVFIHQGGGLNLGK